MSQEFCPAHPNERCPQKTSEGKCGYCGFDFDQPHLTAESLKLAEERAREEFLRKKQDAKDAKLKKEWQRDAAEETDYVLAKSSKDGLKSFLEKWPKGKKAGEALLLKEKYEREEAERVRAEAEQKARKEAQSKERAIEEASEYEAAKGAKEDLIAFLEKWPEGNLAAKAREQIRTIEIELDRITTENKMWEVAEKNNSVTSYSLYLEEYPSGKYARRAQAAIFGIKTQSIFYWILVLVCWIPSFATMKLGFDDPRSLIVLGVTTSIGSAWVAYTKCRRWLLWAVIGLIFSGLGFLFSMLVRNLNPEVHYSTGNGKRIFNVIFRDLCLQIAPLFVVLFQASMGYAWVGLIFGYLWFNFFTMNMAKIVFGEIYIVSELDPETAWPFPTGTRPR